MAFDQTANRLWNRSGLRKAWQRHSYKHVSGSNASIPAKTEKFYPETRIRCTYEERDLLSPVDTCRRRITFNFMLSSRIRQHPIWIAGLLVLRRDHRQTRTTASTASKQKHISDNQEHTRGDETQFRKASCTGSTA